MRYSRLTTSLLLLMFLVPGAFAKPEFAAEVGVTCEFCHIDPDGGGPRNRIGQLFESNDYQFPFEFDIDDPESYFVSHAEAGTMPEIRFGLDLRTAYVRPFEVNASEVVLASCQSCHTSQDTFLLMKAELRATVQPHESLTLEFSNNAGEMLDASATLEVLPDMLRVKTGQFRLPFGLRQQDHNLLVREGYNLGSNRRDVGVELSGRFSPLYYALAVANGRSQFVRVAGTGSDASQHKSLTLDLGVRRSDIQAGVSAYFNKPGNFDSPAEREMRLAAYLQAVIDPVVVQGEFDLGGRFAPGQSFGLSFDTETGDIRSWGGYLAGRAKVTEDAELGVRYGFFDPDRRTGGDRQRRLVLTGSYQLASHASLDFWYWLNIAEPDRPELIDDTVLKRQLEGFDQLILMSRFWW